MADDPDPDPDRDSDRADRDADDDSTPPATVDLEFERAYDRADLATVFRSFAAALEDGSPVRLDGDEESAIVAVPSRVVAEFEAERDPEDEPPVAELGVDLEWDDPDGSSVRLASDAEADREDAVVLAGAERTGEESTTDSAMATMPPEGVAGTDTDSDDAAPESTADGVSTDEQAAPPEQDAGEQTSSSGRTSRFEVYQDRADEWRWRLVHWNGNIVADSGEGYTTRSNAKRAARSVMRTAPTARVTDRDANEN
ncbi:amphi-Trp domain-containing protein [Halopiger aswanensis]|uniref:Amphi-Trp domain-containing protein n=1 Tax=Halopiger aswanensis TaxID=148449 RepID=A0A419WD98_9EURY|nr:amphi-Trp domain-containing protein [Halopiger aswanensis]RKD93458.1 amphi-Trp domain-containing protein [Halopiger aswanensis]